LPRPSHRDVVAAPPFRPSSRSAAAIAIPAKRGVDAAFVVHEARSYQAQTSIPSPCVIAAR
jgi:hypothetical protein